MCAVLFLYLLLERIHGAGERFISVLLARCAFIYVRTGQIGVAVHVFRFQICTRREIIEAKYEITYPASETDNCFSSAVAAELHIAKYINLNGDSVDFAEL